MKNESFLYITPSGSSRVVVLCDHATNIVPDWVNGGDLGITSADMERHIAYDVGALGVATALATQLGAHLVASQFSRLVIDPNRGADDPTQIMKIYDKTIIPVNRAMKDDERAERLNRLYHPYHAKIAEVLGDIRARGDAPIIISMHSFTPQLRGRDPRPWHIGLLSAADRRLTDPMLATLETTGKCIGDNEPYAGSLAGDTMDKHGILNGVQHTLIEVRNDLISDKSGQEEYAQILHDAFTTAAKEIGLEL